jgi:hypothetical protein
MKSLKCKQRGMSYFEFIMLAVALVIVAIFGMKLIPAYIHSAQISQIFREIVADPAMRGAPVSDIEMSYRKRAMIEEINDLKVEDITIEQEGGSLSLSANYFVKIPLAGNVTLLLEFNPSSS